MKNKEIDMQELVDFCNNYNSTGFGKAIIIELKNKFIIALSNAGFSENEEMDNNFRQKYKNDIIYNRHPVTFAEFSKLNLKYGTHIVNYDNLKDRCDCYEKKEIFEYKIEIE